MTPADFRAWLERRGLSAHPQPDRAALVERFERLGRQAGAAAGWETGENRAWNSGYAQACRHFVDSLSAPTEATDPSMVAGEPSMATEPECGKVVSGGAATWGYCALPSGHEGDCCPSRIRGGPQPGAAELRYEGWEFVEMEATEPEDHAEFVEARAGGLRAMRKQLGQRRKSEATERPAQGEAFNELIQLREDVRQWDFGAMTRAEAAVSVLDTLERRLRLAAAPPQESAGEAEE